MDKLQDILIPMLYILEIELLRRQIKTKIEITQFQTIGTEVMRQLKVVCLELTEQPILEVQ